MSGRFRRLCTVAAGAPRPSLAADCQLPAWLPRRQMAPAGWSSDLRPCRASYAVRLRQRRACTSAEGQLCHHKQPGPPACCGKQGGNDHEKAHDRAAENSAREVVMGLVDPDPLSVLPVRAASASAAFARACDPGRDNSERCEHLNSLELTLTSLRQLLDRCEQATARLAAEVRSPDTAPPGSRPCRSCRHCRDGAAGCSDRVGRLRSCGWGIQRVNEEGRCGQPGVVTVRDLAGSQEVLCLSHAADAVRMVHHLSIVAASRSSRAVLAEVAGATCVVGRRTTRLPEADGRARRA
jgi:hypothetical protein